MQRFEHNWRQSYRPFWQSWAAAALAAQAVILLALVGLALHYPGASKWISQAVDAEFVNATPPQDAPTQLAEPSGQTRTLASRQR
jgi:hypothetical protein